MKDIKTSKQIVIHIYKILFLIMNDIVKLCLQILTIHVQNAVCYDEELFSDIY